MKKVLIVEDNQLNAKLFSDILEFNGYKILCLDDGIDLIKKLEGFSPDIILMDIQLPTISGFDLIKIIRNNAKFKDVPIIAITAFVFKEEIEKIMKAGCNEYLSKPIDIKNFVATVNKYSN
jgi:two-component system cell cycle response regulator DivK